MKVVDKGHTFALVTYDGDENAVQDLVFMKRDGIGYPGNIGHYPGTNCQEVIRVLISRAKYLNGQIPCGETDGVITCLRQALWLFESRATRRHGLVFDCPLDGIEDKATCAECGHIKCHHLKNEVEP